jgi:predicted AlkP superfamily pyrophosphatase or phosphodiesterase
VGAARVVLLLAAAAFVAGASQGPGRPPRLVAVFVIDGLRPDSINERDTPTIARLRREGAEYVNSHAVFPTVTRVNTATLTTGTYPALHGIVGNSMYVASVNAVSPFDTGDHTQVLKLDASSGRAVATETLGEVLQRHGRRLVTLSSGSTGNGLLLNPEARRGAGVAIHGLFERGLTAAYPRGISDTVIARFGSPPPDPDDLGQMEWTDNVLREYVLPELRPDVVIDWMGPLDSSQHAHGTGSPEAIDALRRIDASLGRTLARIDALGLSDRTSVIVTSDHGFAHHSDGVDVVGRLVEAGLKRDRTSTDLIAASQSQSVSFYLPARSASSVAALVEFLQGEPWVDVIFTPGGRDGQGSVPGTFSFDLMNLSHATRAPDVVVSIAWSSQPNAYGVAGAHTVTGNATGPLAGSASGHGGLSPWVVRNTFVAWGADVAGGRRIDVPASLADITPTVLTVLGIDPSRGGGRGRVLQELLKGRSATAKPAVTRRDLVTSRGAYRATVTISSVAGHDYLDSGSRVR